MRIVGGTHKGRKFRAPKSIPARPTTDFAKEALFNILESRIDWDECQMLDLFAGIGSISIEACSRGAKSIHAVDMHHGSIRWINQLVTDLNLANVSTSKSDAVKWMLTSAQKFDFVFADPPYAYNDYVGLIDAVISHALKEEAIFVLEHRRTHSFEDHPCYKEDRTYGEVKFSFFNPK